MIAVEGNRYNQSHSTISEGKKISQNTCLECGDRQQVHTSAASSSEGSGISVASVEEQLRKLVAPWQQSLPGTNCSSDQEDISSYDGVVFAKPVLKKKQLPLAKHKKSPAKGRLQFEANSSNQSVLTTRSLKRTPEKAKKKKVFTELVLDRTPSTEKKILQHKFVQCSLMKTKGREAEAILPREIRPLLIDLTLLLHEIKQSSEMTQPFEELYSLTSRTTKITTEFCGRSILQSKLKKTDSFKKMEVAARDMRELLKQHSSGAGKMYDSLMFDLKRLEQGLLEKDSEIASLKGILQEKRSVTLKKPTDIQSRLKNSIWENETLKAEIKFNRLQAKKHKKMLTEREWIRKELRLDLEHLQKKVSKLSEDD